MAAASLIKPPPLLPLRPGLNLFTVSLITCGCGPRGNRGPLVRGRTLSTEAILAVQALKRAGKDESKIGEIASRTLSRLIKADLLAALSELRRQGQWRLALKAFVVVRREFWDKSDCSLYAEMVAALARHGMEGEIDLLVSDLLAEQEEGVRGITTDDVRGLTRLVKALIAAGRGKAARDVYKEMKRGSCVPDEFLFRVLIRGLRRLGEWEAADEVQKDFEVWFEGGVGTNLLVV